jgi:hypothetical protein
MTLDGTAVPFDWGEPVERGVKLPRFERLAILFVGVFRRAEGVAPMVVPDDQDVAGSRAWLARRPSKSHMTRSIGSSAMSTPATLRIQRHRSNHRVGRVSPVALGTIAASTVNSGPG